MVIGRFQKESSIPEKIGKRRPEEKQEKKQATKWSLNERATGIHVNAIALSWL
jgi:hypothetical protein